MTTTNPTPAPAQRGLPRWLTLTLIGLAAAAALFGGGYATDHFTRFQPMQADLSTQLANANGKLAVANETLAALQSQISQVNADLAAANGRISGLEGEKTALQASLDQAGQHVELLRAVREVQAANLLLAAEDLSGAKVALTSTAARLETLKPVITSVDPALAETMGTRLGMVATTMETDVETARTDLGVLAGNLLNAETLLYK